MKDITGITKKLVQSLKSIKLPNILRSWQENLCTSKS